MSLVPLLVAYAFYNVHERELDVRKDLARTTAAIPVTRSQTVIALTKRNPVVLLLHAALGDRVGWDEVVVCSNKVRTVIILRHDR